MDSQPTNYTLANYQWQEPQPRRFVEFDDAKIELMRKTIARGASDEEIALFVEYCTRTGLDPFSRQIYSVRRKQWNAQARAYEEAQVIQVSIDGFRLIADRTRKYAGQVGPWWCGPDGEWREIWLEDEPPSAAKVGVLRHDFINPVYSIALYKSYVQVNGHGEPISRWKTDPAGMLAKCAESLALRRAFPNELSGLYSTEEMEQADNPQQLTAAPAGAFLGPSIVVTTTQNSSDTNQSAAPALPEPAAQPETPAAPAGLTDEALADLEKELAAMTLEQAQEMPDSRGGRYGDIKPDQLEYRKKNMEKMLGKVDAEKETEYRRKLRAIALLQAEAKKQRENQIMNELGYPADPQPPSKFDKYRKALEQQDAPTAFWMLIRDSKWKQDTAKALLDKNGGDFKAAFEELITRLQQPG